jgi:taurine dioxygenase
MSISIIPASGAGAYVTGVDLNKVAPSDLQLMKDTLGQYGVMFFRKQDMSPEAHIEFAEEFGTININRFFTPVAEYPQIAQVLKEADQKKNIGVAWHTDHSYDQIPALGSILVARELPKTGGDTLFISMFAAYDALSDDMKSKLDGLTAVHSSRHVFGKAAYLVGKDDELLGRLGNTDAATQDAIHPLVIDHPFSGRKALYVNPEFTVRISELPESQGSDLLEELYSHCQQDDFMHRFQWEQGTVVFWDNRASWHKALNDYPGERRYMHRITIEGVPLV